MAAPSRARAEVRDDVVAIRAGALSAGVARDGGRLAWLRDGNVDLVVPSPGPGPDPGFHGAVIAPWPNRIAGGTWVFDDILHRVPVNEPATGSALHGFTPWMQWDVAALADDRLQARVLLPPRDGWPHHLDLRLDAHIDPRALALSLSATNVGTGPAPWGATIHPYLCAPGEPSDWTLCVPADRVLEVDDRMHPLALTAVSGTPHDLRTPRRVGELALDHAFTGLEATGTTDRDRDETAAAEDRDSDQAASATGGDMDHAPSQGGSGVRAELRAPAGTGVHVTWSSSTCPWVQVYTGDAQGVAVEPMTCPPDGFNSGTDVVSLAPSDTHTTTWRLGPLAAPTSSG